MFVVWHAKLNVVWLMCEGVIVFKDEFWNMLLESCLCV